MSQALSFFERVDAHRFRPTEHVGGAWDTTEQHISPMNGLVVHEVERLVRSATEEHHKVIARISVEILGVLPMAEFDLRVEVVRPGRTVELVEATVAAGGRKAVVARVWRLATYDSAPVAGGEVAPLPSPDDLPSWSLDGVWPGGYIKAVDVLPVRTPAPGRTTAWVTTDVDLVAGEVASDLARYVGLIDTANGIAARTSPAEWLFPNLDLTVHLHRQPAGRHVGLDTTVVFGAAGQGLTTTVLHDRDGAVGVANQILTVRPRGS